MGGMFYYASAFNQPLDFNTSMVNFMNTMFYMAIAFNQRLDHWDVSLVWDFTSMFYETPLDNCPHDCRSHNGGRPPDAPRLAM